MITLACSSVMYLLLKKGEKQLFIFSLPHSVLFFSPEHNHQKRTKGSQFWGNLAICSPQEGEGTPETG